MNNIQYISAQPDELFYAWQVEVMLDNFISVGIDQRDVHILVGIQKNVGQWWFTLIEKFKDVAFFFYPDTRLSKVYPPSIRPHILYKHWERFPWLTDYPIFYHDCDMLFTRTPDFSKFLNDKTWYLSDTRSYIGADYIRSKGDNIFNNMCQKLNIKNSVVIEREDCSGGAQYLMKDIFSSFWKRVEIKSESLYSYLNALDSDIQKWTADMWALLWSAWFYNYTTKIDPYLNFSMATDTWPKWDRNLIFHNAGVVPEIKDKLFLKDDFRAILPFTDVNLYDPQFCSYKYFNKIIQTGKKSCLKPAEPDMNQSIFI